MDRLELLFSAEMSVRYHRRRAAFLERLGMLLNLSTLIGGAGAFLSLVGGESTHIAKVATLIITVIGIIQAVYRIDSAASDNRQWLNEWLTILTEIYSEESPSAGKLANWRERKHRIEAQCVSELRALQVDCYNKTIDYMQLDAPHVPIRRYQKALMQLYPFETAFN